MQTAHVDTLLLRTCAISGGSGSGITPPAASRQAPLASAPSAAAAAALDAAAFAAAMAAEVNAGDGGGGGSMGGGPPAAGLLGAAGAALLDFFPGYDYMTQIMRLHHSVLCSPLAAALWISISAPPFAP